MELDFKNYICYRNQRRTGGNKEKNQRVAERNEKGGWRRKMGVKQLKVKRCMKLREGEGNCYAISHDGVELYRV